MYSSPNIVRLIRIRWVEYMAHRKEVKNVYKSLVGKSQGMPVHRWEDSIEMDLREMGHEGVK
jgi:hypothetical protein